MPRSTLRSGRAVPSGLNSLDGLRVVRVALAMNCGSSSIFSSRLPLSSNDVVVCLSCCRPSMSSSPLSSLPATSLQCRFAPILA